ncbi:MAG: glycerate kinase [Syntrophobacteraceae bacterium]|nr:glycerate kinase [Syntrophobacteraceae bacterium]
MAIDWDKASRDAQEIFRAALARVDPIALLGRCLAIEGGKLAIRTEYGEARLRLDDYDRIVVTGMGKGSAQMALGVERVLGERVSAGLIAVMEGGKEVLSRVAVVEAGHPLPDLRSLRAGGAILALGKVMDERTLALVLLSGGGSALACAPVEGLSLEVKIEASRLLLHSGATIQEVNCVRKHLSAVKGGRLAQALAPATVVSLILSDVIGDDLDAIASGPTVADPTTFADSLEILKRYGIENRAPVTVTNFLRRGAEGKAQETPKPGDPVFSRVKTLLIGTNREALAAAKARAQELGYETMVLTSRLTGEAREAALTILGIGKDICASGFPVKRPACVLLGGETTVTVCGTGKGGRNQEMALAFLAALSRAPKDGEDLLFFSASTDGKDGETEAAGALASSQLLARARAAGMHPQRFLSNNDSYNFFNACGGLIQTGPTHTNVCDIQILLVP